MKMDDHHVKTSSLDRRVLGTESRGLSRASFPKKENDEIEIGVWHLQGYQSS